MLEINISHSGLSKLDTHQTINGNFDCKFNYLTSLKGGPTKVKGYYDCSNNMLVTLEGCCDIVKGDFICSSNKLTDLKYAPLEVDGSFYCNDNNIQTLVGFRTKVINGLLRLGSFYEGGLGLLLISGLEGIAIPKFVPDPDKYREPKEVVNILNKYIKKRIGRREKVCSNLDLLHAKIELEKAGLSNYTKL